MSDSTPDFNRFHCPAPLATHETIQLAHGGGGRLMRQLINELFLPAFRREGDTEGLRQPPHDSAEIRLGDGTRMAFTTDAFVVSPLFFPGGDIGKLAVFGTVNDLAMAGAKPLWLSASFILEEGLPVEVLSQVVRSMRAAADEASVRIIAGDTKVVDRGKGDGLYISMAGLGWIPENVHISPAHIRPGDKVILSGDIGRHGIAIMSVREGLQFENALPSDCAPLHRLVRAMVKHNPAAVHCVRDLTRGGLATALNELAQDSHVGFLLDESRISVMPPVAAACEMLGLDPLYVANEGRFIAIVSPEAAEDLVEVIRGQAEAANPQIIGEVRAEPAGIVEMKTAYGSTRILDWLSGEQMPRIC
ncbi:MAG: hydrogenase expression/formation protein HypE [Thermogutta sp.]